MSKQILLYILAISTVIALVGGATYATFSDTETSSGNTFTAGSIDLKIDYQCPKPGCDFSLRDLNGESFFKECDIKPGDSGEVTISWHVYDNNAWARLRFADIVNYENGCTEPESKVDRTCGDPGLGEGELIDNLVFTIWMDEGSIKGWQCPDNSNRPCSADPEEGNNILDGIETPIVSNKSLSEIISEGGVKLPGELENSTTYYLGVKWTVLPTVGNIIQTDSLVGKIVMEVVQSRNNPTPWQ